MTPFMTDRTLWLPDVNVLVAAHVADHPHHPAALTWLRATPNYLITPITESGLIRNLLNPAITDGVTKTAALDAVRRLTSNQRCTVVSDDSSLTRPLVNLSGWAGYRQTTDFHLLNLAAECRAVLVTMDRKFTKAVHTDDQRYVHLLPA